MGQTDRRTSKMQTSVAKLFLLSLLVLWLPLKIISVSGFVD